MEIKECKVLIVDDQQANLNVLRSFLIQHDFEVRIAENGERALKVLELYQPETILLDVMMPGLNGFDTCRRIKENPKTADIPVIFMTALAMHPDRCQLFGNRITVGKHGPAIAVTPQWFCRKKGCASDIRQ